MLVSLLLIGEFQRGRVERLGLNRLIVLTSQPLGRTLRQEERPLPVPNPAAAAAIPAIRPLRPLRPHLRQRARRDAGAAQERGRRARKGLEGGVRWCKGD